MHISIFNDACLAKNTKKENDNLMLYTNSGKILLTSIDLSTGVDGENDDGSDNSVYIPPPDDDSDLNRKYCPSDKDNDREDVFFDRKRILEELDPIW